MSDTIKTDYTLNITWNFDDGDTRKISIANPRADLTATEVTDYGAWCANNNVIIGDKTGASLNSAKPILKASVKNSYTIYKDLT